MITSIEALKIAIKVVNRAEKKEYNHESVVIRLQAMMDYHQAIKKLEQTKEKYDEEYL